MSNPDPVWSFSIRCGRFPVISLEISTTISATSKFGFGKIGLGLEEAAQLADSAASWWLSFNPFEKYAHQIGSFTPKGWKKMWNHLVLTMGAKSFGESSNVIRI